MMNFLKSLINKIQNPNLSINPHANKVLLSCLEHIN